ncbi:MAG: LLM class flavin-dependent oxidoreductase [Candidatus Bathyarchaeia archaeon]|nr:LLM class flavin-dependent oxidoreductase [Candidatus Bathyarchaeota archaeon]
MKFGISPAPCVWWTKLEELEKWAQTAENLGYDAILIPDHYAFPSPPFPSDKLVDTWTTLSYVAAKTTRIRLGSMVSPIPRWIPSQLAKVITMVDILSNGRTIAGLGAGYYRDEFVNYSPSGILDEPRVRFEKFLEGLQIMLKLWSEEKVTFKGKYYTLVDATLMPKPVQKPHPPLWSGAQRTRMIEVTAKYFDGWIPHTFKWEWVLDIGSKGISSPEEYSVYVERIKKLLRNFGRDGRNFTFGVLGELDFDIKRLERYSDAGCQYVVVEIAPSTKPEQYLELTKKFAKEIMPSFI